MRTTVDLDEALLDRARQAAERRGITLPALIEQGLRLALRKPLNCVRRAPVVLPESRAGGRAAAGVDLNDTADLLDRMDGRG